MIQVNLLPDIKAAYVKAESTKRLVIGISVIVIAACVTIIGLLCAVAFGAQQLQLSKAQDAIKENVAKLDNVQDLDKVLTIQNQLIELSPIHNTKPVVSRLFNYLQQTTPQDLQITSLTVDFDEHKIMVGGSAPSLEQVNRYVDTLKFTEYSVAGVEDSTSRAFSSVVMSGFGTSSGKATYSIDLSYEPVLFDSTSSSVALVIPAITTTRSQTQLPSALFTPSTEGQ